MKKNPMIQKAIDESLSSVHFTAQDMHSVLRAVRAQDAPQPVPVRRRSRPLHFMLAAAMAAMIIVPVSLLVIRAGSIKPADITTIAAVGDAVPSPAHDPVVTPDITTAPACAAFTADDAVAAARACFETHCDISVFTFEEYTVDVQTLLDYGEDAASAGYEVTMTSVYGNGCTFRVQVSPVGDVLSFSTPRLATVPTHLDSESAEIRAWYDTYGRHIFTWPMDMQAEFSRRYEGGMLRMPKEDELPVDALAACAAPLSGMLPGGGGSLTVYPMLYDGRAFADGQARYQLYCFSSSDIRDGDVCLLITLLAANGAIESSELTPVSRL